MKQNSPKYYKVYTAADGRVCIASVEFAADFGANAPENCPCMGYIKVMHGNKRADAPCYLMPAKMAKLLKPEEYRPAPTGGSSPAAPKCRPDAATMALYWLLTEAAAFADADPQRVFENGQYKLIAKEAPDMLKRLKREFNITKADLKTYPPTVAPAPVQDQQQPEPAPAPVADAAAVVFTDSMDDAIEARTSEAVTLPAWAVDGVRCVYDSRDEGKLTGTAARFHWSAVGHCWLCDFTSGHTSIIGALVERMAPAPVEDIEAAVVAHFEDLAANAPADGPAADIVRAGIETGKVIICSVPKAEPAPQLPKPPAVVYIDTPTNQKTDNPPAKKTAADEFIESGAYPIWYNSELVCSSHTGVAFKVVSWGRKQVKVEYDNGQRRIFPVRVFIDSVERGDIIVAAPYDAEYMAKLNQPTPSEQKTAPTDAEVMETAARIRANYEAMQADIEAEREQAAAAFAEAITAYCEELSRPEPLAWEPETIIIPFEPRPAAEVEQPRRRHRLNLRPRLSRWLHPVRWVAVAFVVCLLSGLLLGMNTSTAAADDIAAAYELAPVNVTAEAPDTFIEDKAPCLIEDKAPCLIEDKAPCLIEDKAPAPSPVKKLAAPSPVKNATADAVTLPNQKTASDMATSTAPAAPLAPATDSDGLTICAGTAWAYTMMNWA